MNSSGVYAGAIAIAVVALIAIIATTQVLPSQERSQQSNTESLTEVQQAWTQNAIQLDRTFSDATSDLYRSVRTNQCNVDWGDAVPSAGGYLACQNNFPKQCGLVIEYFYSVIQKTTLNGIQCYPQPYYFDLNTVSVTNLIRTSNPAVGIKVPFFSSCVDCTGRQGNPPAIAPPCTQSAPIPASCTCTNNSYPAITNPANCGEPYVRSGYVGFLSENYNVIGGRLSPSPLVPIYMDFNLTCAKTTQDSQGVDLNIVFSKRLRLQKWGYVAENVKNTSSSPGTGACKFIVFDANSNTIEVDDTT